MDDHYNDLVEDVKDSLNALHEAENELQDAVEWIVKCRQRYTKDVAELHNYRKDL